MPARHSSSDGGVALELLERVARRVEDQLDRVEERAVEIEEDRGRSARRRRCGGAGMAIQKVAASMHRMPRTRSAPPKPARAK